MDLLNSVREHALAADETGRKAIVDQLNHLARELETPQDCMQRILYLPMTLPVVRAGCDIGLFNHIVDSATPLSSAQLAEKCGGASPVLLARLLRYMSSMDVVRETAPDQYGPTTTTRTLASQDWQGAVYHYADVCTPCMTAMPDFLKERGYQDSEDPADCAFNRGHKTDMRCFEWYEMRPAEFAHFHRFMRVQRDGLPTWLDAYPYLAAARGDGADPDRALFVDVGGGIGHQSVALRRALPADVSGRVVVQDQPSVAAQGLRCGGVEHMPHDFFAPQPVRGARMYYLRNILHDLCDEDAVAVLGRLRQAMAEDSRVLVDEMVLREEGVHRHAAQLDILMMVAVAGRERTIRQWEELVPRAGLKIRKVYRYTESLGDSIIECVRDDLEEKETLSGRR